MIKMELKGFKKDKGVAGLNVLLTVIIMLFVIGFLVMIFALMGGELTEEMWDSTTVSIVNSSTATVVNETGVRITGTTGLKNCVLSVSALWNYTGVDPIATGNASVSGCTIACNSCTAGLNNTRWNVTGSYTYDADSTASTTINQSTTSISSVTDWFSIIIIITVMVVLILLTVIIISAIRGSGLISAGGSSTPRETA